MPVMRRRVVCGLLEVMLTLAPTRRLRSVDLPTLGRPMIATRPAGCTGAASGARCEVIRLPRGLLLGAAAAGALPPRTYVELGNHAFDLELLLVRLAPRGDDRIVRQREVPCLQVLLQHRLRVLARDRRVDGIERFSQQRAHHPARRL